jgi:2-oxoglutarate ferredoxin oxidoreductase subunit gamma
VPKIRAKIFKIPATKMAETKLKSKIFVNMVMLGALTKTTGIVTQQAVEKAITESVPSKTKENNIRGFRIGLNLTISDHNLE